MFGVLKREMCLIWLLGPTLLLHEIDTCDCKGCFCDSDMFPVFLFLTKHLLKFEHKSTDKRRMETFCLLTTSRRKVYFYCAVHHVHMF